MDFPTTLAQPVVHAMDQECFGLLLISQIHQTCSDFFFRNPDKCQKNVFNILSLGHSSAVGSQLKPNRGVRRHFGWIDSDWCFDA